MTSPLLVQTPTCKCAFQALMSLELARMSKLLVVSPYHDREDTDKSKSAF